MFTKCSLSGTSQLSFCDSPLLFRPHLALIYTPAVPFSLQMWVSISCTCHHTPSSPRYSQEPPPPPKKRPQAHIEQIQHGTDTRIAIYQLRHTTKDPASFDTGSFSKINRQRPTLPHPQKCSTIGAKSLSFWVRNGTRRFPLAIITGKWRRGDSNP